MKSRCSSLLVAVLCFWGATPVTAAEPIVQNLVMQQHTDGSRIIDITYDVSDADGDTLLVALQLSADGGASWDFPVLNCTGDIGDGVLSGTGRHIALDLGPTSAAVEGDYFQARILARRRPR